MPGRIAYEEIEKTLALKKEERTAFLNRMKEKIRERVTQEHKNVYIEGRVKSIYGIYRKVYMNGRAFEEIYDIYAIRLIVDTVFDCYNILGIIHDMFRPIPNRFKDYISTPKSNMYQSLHTTVVDKEGIPFEVQIRTWDMHYTRNTELRPIGNTKPGSAETINSASAWPGCASFWRHSRNQRMRKI